MIGLNLLLGALTLFIILLFLEGIIRFQKEKPLHKTFSRIATSANLNLILYELVAILVTIGFPLLIEESQDPFLVEVFPTAAHRLVLGFFFIIGVLVVNVLRYQRLGLDMVDAKRIYYVAASNAEGHELPEKGLDEAIALVNKLRSGCPTATEQGFLEYLSSRNDTLGEIARQKHSAI